MSEIIINNGEIFVNGFWVGTISFTKDSVKLNTEIISRQDFTDVMLKVLVFLREK